MPLNKDVKSLVNQKLEKKKIKNWIKKSWYTRIKSNEIS